MNTINVCITVQLPRGYSYWKPKLIGIQSNIICPYIHKLIFFKFQHTLSFITFNGFFLNSLFLLKNLFKVRQKLNKKRSFVDDLINILFSNSNSVCSILDYVFFAFVVTGQLLKQSDRCVYLTPQIYCDFRIEFWWKFVS